MMLLVLLSPLVALGLMLALQALETSVLEAGPSTHPPRRIPLARRYKQPRAKALTSTQGRITRLRPSVLHQ